MPSRYKGRFHENCNCYSTFIPAKIVQVDLRTPDPTRIPVEPRILHISIKKTSKPSAPYLPHKTDIYPSLDSAAVAFAPYIATKLKTHIPTPRPAMRAPENPKPPVNYYSSTLNQEDVKTVRAIPTPQNRHPRTILRTVSPALHPSNARILSAMVQLVSLHLLAGIAAWKCTWNHHLHREAKHR